MSVHTLTKSNSENIVLDGISIQYMDGIEEIKNDGIDMNKYYLVKIDKPYKFEDITDTADTCESDVVELSLLEILNVTIRGINDKFYSGIDFDCYFNADHSTTIYHEGKALSFRALWNLSRSWINKTYMSFYLYKKPMYFEKFKDAIEKLDINLGNGLNENPHYNDNMIEFSSYEQEKRDKHIEKLSKKDHFLKDDLLNIAVFESEWIEIYKSMLNEKISLEVAKSKLLSLYMEKIYTKYGKGDKND